MRVDMPWHSPINPLLPGGESLCGQGIGEGKLGIQTTCCLAGLALLGKCKTQPLGPCCIAWSRSHARIHGKGCISKGIRHENFASNPMNRADTNLDPARASPSSDAQEHRLTFARNGLRLPYHDRIQLKKIAQRRRRRDNKGKGKTIRGLPP